MTSDQRAHFHERGWLVVDQVIPDGLRAELLGDLDAIDVEVEAQLRSLPAQRSFILEAGAITFRPHLVALSDAARQASTAPVIVDLCHDLVGNDVRLYWDQMVYKKPDKPRDFPWHQDNGYAYVDPQQYLTVWVALEDATADNGCPRVASGAHLEGTLEHHYVDPLGYVCFDPATHIPSTAIAEVPAGGAVVFSSLTPHMTGPNLSSGVRKAYILQYAPDGAEVWDGDPTTGPPTARRIQNDAARQYPVLVGGRAIA